MSEPINHSSAKMKIQNIFETLFETYNDALDAAESLEELDAAHDAYEQGLADMRNEAIRLGLIDPNDPTSSLTIRYPPDGLE